MQTLFFTVNKKQKTLFENLKKQSQCEGKIIYSKKLFLPSLSALRYLKQVDLSKPIALKTKDFKAKFGFESLEFFIKAIYTFLAYFNYFRYFNAITEEYDQILLWNGILFRQAIALEIAKLHNIQPIFAEIGLLPNRIVLDRNGVNYLNSVPREKSFFEAYHNDRPLPDTLIPRNPKNAKKFSNVKAIQLPQKYIFIPFQVDYDTQILEFSPWIKDMRMLFDVVENITKITDINFVFKEHPSSIKNYTDLHQRASKNDQLYFANGHTTQELIEKSDAVITINSTVGIESLLFTKKVIVLGNAFYAIQGISKCAMSQNELNQIVTTLDKWEIGQNLIENFLKYLYYDYLINNCFDQYQENEIKYLRRFLCPNIK